MTKRAEQDTLHNDMYFLFQRIQDFDLFVGDANVSKEKADISCNTEHSVQLGKCFNANVFIKKLAYGMRHRFPKHQDIKLNLSNVPLTCHSEFHLGKALHNIVLNAMQATQPSQRVSIGSHTQNGFLYIEVSDTGCGISSENLEKVFSPFYTTKNSKHGTGLGLAISKQIIIDYDGRISLCSKLNEGTRLQVKLPLTKWYLH